ncbi:unnamed protein product, partial [Gulo gulo]
PYRDLGDCWVHQRRGTGTRRCDLVINTPLKQCRRQNRSPKTEFPKPSALN